MYLRDDNLAIRNAADSDAQLLCDWWNDGKIMEHAGFPKGLGTTKDAVLYLLKRDSDSDRRLILEIDSRPAGEMNYRDVGNKTAELGIKICVLDKQGMGYGTRFLRMLINYLLEQGYEKIILDTNAKNLRAQHVYEKLGFRKMGVKVDSWRNQLGELQSSVDYELKGEDFIK
jgi:RimJ/RimL family protein N-acetyltransferase